MMNILFGIILDTFAGLRSIKKEKEDDMMGRCFICNIVCARACTDRFCFSVPRYL
jgi:hypothetical protein